MQFRDVPQVEPPGQFSPEKRARMVECLEGVLLIPFVSSHDYMHIGMPRIGGELDSRDVHGTYARVVHFEADDLG